MPDTTCCTASRRRLCCRSTTASSRCGRTVVVGVSPEHCGSAAVVGAQVVGAGRRNRLVEPVADRRRGAERSADRDGAEVRRGDPLGPVRRGALETDRERIAGRADARDVHGRAGAIGAHADDVGDKGYGRRVRAKPWRQRSLDRVLEGGRGHRRVRRGREPVAAADVERVGPPVHRDGGSGARDLGNEPAPRRDRQEPRAGCRLKLLLLRPVAPPRHGGHGRVGDIRPDRRVGHA